MTTEEGTEKLVSAQVAARLGITVGTLYGYRSRPVAGHPFPKPDGWHDKRTPWWWDTTIDAHKAAGLKPGTRTDLKPAESDTTGDV